MKIKFFSYIAVAAVLGLASCVNENARLAGELNGSWNGETMITAFSNKGNLSPTESIEMSCTPRIKFDRLENTVGGALSIEGDYTVTTGVEAISTVTPVTMTISGTLKATGAWSVDDGDDIDVTIDATSVIVDVDTATMALRYSVVTDASPDSLLLMRNSIAANIAEVIRPMISKRISSLREFDDVTVTGQTMVMEIRDRKVLFTKL